MKWPWQREKREGAFLDREDGYRILQRVSPRLNADKCLECGALRDRSSSPEITTHDPECPGMARWCAVRVLLIKVLYE